MSEAGSEDVSKTDSQQHENSGMISTQGGASSGISGLFKAIPGDDNCGHQWSFNFNKAQNEVDFTVTLSSPAVLMDIDHQHLKTTLALDDINQLIMWLFQVKSIAKKAMEISNSTTQASVSAAAKGAAPAGAAQLSAPVKR
ncbi:hypothetical protein [uncultured Shewanella sp.]|uniref:hypothetical protein n=1 Tax=uncultured Shewanella sp. TaxID=173975 RepID=UPI00261BBBCB|nr:hypothetical protein [uncultured Shewanella sp.]